MYGTSSPSSDLDIRGVFIPSKEYFHGFLHRTEQYEDRKNDIVFYEIRKFMTLALKANPTLLEFFFVPENCLLETTTVWEEIVENRDLFLSTKCKHTFSGYAFSQLKRIKNHREWLLNPPKKKPERKDFNLPESKSLLTGEQIGAFNEIIATYLKQIGQFHKLKELLEEMEEFYNYKTIVKNLVNVDFKSIQTIVPLSNNVMYALEKEKRYSNSLKHWNQYQNWKRSRNPDRAKLEKEFGYDTKHAMHLYRLVDECKELLTTGKIIFPRPDREHLLAIRNGLYKYDELMERFNNINGELENLYNNSILPKKAKVEKVDKLCVNIIDSYLESSSILKKFSKRFPNNYKEFDK
jgi:predicted nucleotidyltransferase